MAKLREQALKVIKNKFEEKEFIQELGKGDRGYFCNTYINEYLKEYCEKVLGELKTLAE